jgi:Hemerythrin HHE cation binding domain
VTAKDPDRAHRWIGEHRALDNLLGQFLAAASAGESAAAREAIGAFDEALRRHTAAEEEEVFHRQPGQKLLPKEEEGDRDRLLRELALEHVQIRELSGILVRLWSESADSPGRGLVGNLLSRWDAHTAREERGVHSDHPEVAEPPPGSPGDPSSRR